MKSDKSLFYKEDGFPNSSDSGCVFGDYYLDQENKTLSICVNKK